VKCFASEAEPLKQMPFNWWHLFSVCSSTWGSSEQCQYLLFSCLNTCGLQHYYLVTFSTPARRSHGQQNKMATTQLFRQKMVDEIDYLLGSHALEEGFLVKNFTIPPLHCNKPHFQVQSGSRIKLVLDNNIIFMGMYVGSSWV
jgi:hypothetical protein